MTDGVDILSRSNKSRLAASSFLTQHGRDGEDKRTGEREEALFSLKGRKAALMSGGPTAGLGR